MRAAVFRPVSVRIGFNRKFDGQTSDFPHGHHRRLRHRFSTTLRRMLCLEDSSAVKYSRRDGICEREKQLQVVIYTYLLTYCRGGAVTITALGEA